MSKKICVLGGTGYLGKVLVERLLHESHTVMVVHREQSDVSELMKLENRNLILCNQDKNNFDFKGVDCVINCVCAYERANISMLDILEANFQYPMRMLSLAIENNVPEFISINTSLPREVNAYALSKNQFNEWGKYKSHLGEIQFTNVILENYYGLNEPETRFLPSVIKKMKLNQDILLTEGKQRRDFISIYDVINVLELVIGKEDKSVYYEIPLGTGEAPRVREVIEFIHQELLSQSQLCFGAVPLRKTEPDSVADVTALKALGYEIQYDWKKGIKLLLEEKV